MMLKELYNLGVLNGPDLDLMNQVIPSATEIPGNPLQWYDRANRVRVGINQGLELMNGYKNQYGRRLGMEPVTFTPLDLEKNKYKDESKRSLTKKPSIIPPNGIDNKKENNNALPPLPDGFIVNN